MGGLVEQSIEKATRALLDRDPKKLAEVYEIERRINGLHIDVDNACMEILARHSPVATDLRLILAVIKINTDLERMGDQAVNISHNTEHYLDDHAVDAKLNLPRMSQLVRSMVRDSLDAFMSQNFQLAQQVLLRDDEVDEFKNESFKILIEYMKTQPSGIEGALDLLLIARNLERMADHATNIAEDVIFAFTGADVRHGMHQPQTT